MCRSLRECVHQGGGTGSHGRPSDVPERHHPRTTASESLRALKRLRGVPIAKANAEPRPIGIESLFMKMVASMAIKALEPQIQDVLGPLEFGFGVKGSAEALTHFLRS